MSRFKSKICSIYATLKTNLGINWVNKESLQIDDVQDVIEVCETLNPIVEELFEKGDLRALADKFENWNFLIYFVYGIEYKVHEAFELDSSKEEEENWEWFNKEVKRERENLIEKLF